MKSKGAIPAQVQPVVIWFYYFLAHARCHFFGHRWIEQGGRSCPKSRDIHRGECTQIVFRCLCCREWDYGDKGGPAWHECTHCFR